MKAILAVILIGLGALIGLGTQGTAQVESNSTPTEAERQQILQATLRIDMAVGEEGVDRIDGNALGSVAVLDGQMVVLTHNHWAQLLDETSTITLRAADYTPITTLTGSELYSSVLYQDAGTILFTAPEALRSYLQETNIETPAAMVGKELKPGSVVWSAYFPGVVGEELGVRPMVVEPGNVEQHPPVYRLRSLDGSPNQQGDSGGGAWWDGMLVGNLWSIVMEPSLDGDWQDSNVSNVAMLNW